MVFMRGDNINQVITSNVNAQTVEVSFDAVRSTRPRPRHASRLRRPVHPPRCLCSVLTDQLQVGWAVECGWRPGGPRGFGSGRQAIGCLGVAPVGGGEKK